MDLKIKEKFGEFFIFLLESGKINSIKTYSDLKVQLKSIIFILYSKAARELLTLDNDNPKRQFEGEALMTRMHRIGVLSPEENKLDYVLGLNIEKFLDRRLQTIVFNSKSAKSIHEARSVIFQKKISIGRGNKKQVVNIPSFIVKIKKKFRIKHLKFR